jgi:hypothetical protein
MSPLNQVRGTGLQIERAERFKLGIVKRVAARKLPNPVWIHRHERRAAGHMPDIRRRQAELDRRSLLRCAAAMAVGVSPLAGLVAACGTGERRGEMMPDGESSTWMMSRGTNPQMMRDMPVIHDLLVNHDAINRQVMDIAGGISAVTTSPDPRVAQRIQSHV